MKNDELYIVLLQLLSKARSTDIRKRIIKTFKKPFSEETLACLAKRLRDISPEIAVLIYQQLTDSGCRLSDFP
jgi:hypothetical protein